MADKRSSVNSDTYNDPVIEEATVGVKGDVATLRQLISSGNASRDRRAEKAMDSLRAAAAELKSKTKGGSGQDKGGQSK